MSNFMKNAKSWLGLGQDPYYEYGDPEIDDGYDDDEDDIVDVTPLACQHRDARPGREPPSRDIGRVVGALGDITCVRR